MRKTQKKRGQDQSREALSTPAVKTWQELLDACCQNRHDHDFNNESNFPLEPVASSDEEEWEVYKYHFPEMVNGEVALRRLEELGYRPCGPRRAMENIAAHPDVQPVGHSSLVVTVRWLYRAESWYAPIFYRNDGKRSLYLGRLDDSFHPDDGWLVLRKRP